VTLGSSVDWFSWWEGENWSSEEAHMVDALAQTGEEGRGKLR